MSDEELEAALRRVMAAGPQELAAKRLLGRLHSLPQQKRALAWWPAALMDASFAPAWPRLAALAAAAVLGISIGFSSIGSRIATNLNLVTVANADDASVSVFETDSGLRP
jgi:hypothetical protein